MTYASIDFGSDLVLYILDEEHGVREYMTFEGEDANILRRALDDCLTDEERQGVLENARQIVDDKNLQLYA